MMKFIKPALAAFFGVVLAQANTDIVAAAGTLIANNKTYDIVDLQWNIQINNTDTPYNISVNGTVQDVFTNIAIHDPTRAAQINQSIIEINKTISQAAPQSLLRRDPSYTPINHYCNNFDRAYLDRIWNGVSYLNGVPGKPGNGPGPGACGRVSCSYNSAIYWCNDNLETKILDRFGAIADGAELILWACNPKQTIVVSGQQFFEDGWNVIVKLDSC